MDRTLTKNTTGIKTTKKIRIQVIVEANVGFIFFEKKEKTGLKIPAEIIPRRIVAKKGATSLPISPMAIQNKTRKKTNTAFGEIFCSKVSP